MLKVIFGNVNYLTLFFGDFNPYKEEIFGDWLVTVEETKHLGDVYLNGMSFYEVGSYEELINPTVKTEVIDHWTQKKGSCFESRTDKICLVC